MSAGPEHQGEVNFLPAFLDLFGYRICHGAHIRLVRLVFRHSHDDPVKIGRAAQPLDRFSIGICAGSLREHVSQGTHVVHKTGDMQAPDQTLAHLHFDILPDFQWNGC